MPRPQSLFGVLSPTSGTILGGRIEEQCDCAPKRVFVRLVLSVPGPYASERRHLQPAMAERHFHGTVFTRIEDIGTRALVRIADERIGVRPAADRGTNPPQLGVSIGSAAGDGIVPRASLLPAQRMQVRGWLPSSTRRFLTIRR